MLITIARGLLLALLAIPPFSAAHAAQRTFVSTSGSDSNACSLGAPCRTFAQAIIATDSRGEIIVLDSGGYGRVTIDKTVTIEAPPGVYAGIAVFPGTNGIDIAMPGLGVKLRGLTINGQGGDDGIFVHAAATVDIERCAIANMTRHGIHSDVDGVKISVKDSSTLDNGQTGIRLVGDMKFLVERVRSDGNGTAGIHVHDGATGSITDSGMAGNSTNGLLVQAGPADVTMAVTVSRSRVHANASHGVSISAGQPGSTIRFEASESVISGNGVNGVLVFGFSGGTILSTLRGNTIAHNGGIGANVNFSGATLNVADNVIVGNVIRGLSQSPSAVLNSIGDNIVRDNDGGATSGVVTPIVGI